MITFIGCSLNEVDVSKLTFQNGNIYNADSVFFNYSTKNFVYYNNKKFTGFAIGKYENGSLASKAEFHDGLANGILTTYFQNGQIWDSGTFNQGIFNGKLKIYYENGQISQSANIRDGMFQDTNIIFEQNGNRRQADVYINSKLEGVSKVYYQNGNLKLNRNYIHDELSGKVELFDSAEGYLWQSGNYENGKLSGIVYTYNKLGVVILKENYDKGNLINNSSDQSKEITRSQKSEIKSIKSIVRKNEQRRRAANNNSDLNSTASHVCHNCYRKFNGKGYYMAYTRDGLVVERSNDDNQELCCSSECAHKIMGL